MNEQDRREIENIIREVVPVMFDERAERSINLSFKATTAAFLWFIGIVLGGSVAFIVIHLVSK